eukprot:24015-Eustigmatos_ZCMA.PRE.1
MGHEHAPFAFSQRASRTRRAGAGGARTRLAVVQQRGNAQRGRRLGGRHRLRHARRTNRRPAAERA